MSVDNRNPPCHPLAPRFIVGQIGLECQMAMTSKPIDFRETFNLAIPQCGRINDTPQADCVHTFSHSI